jgi:7-carboxy-7-deazaguanine synthase
MIIINEIFPSIQGESTFQGLPTVFVRLTGCNLRCSYCDTTYAFKDGSECETGSIIDTICSFGIRHVCITGGEPLLQAETPVLAAKLIESGKTVSIETNGTIDVSVLDAVVKAIIDVKCPGSSMSGQTFVGNLTSPRSGDEFKFVLTGREDFIFASDIVKKFYLSEKNTVLFSPVLGSLDPAELAGWIVNEMPDVRLNLQIHKYIWAGTSEKESVHSYIKEDI